jgi:ketosteroid isomerase-like protein
MLTNHRKDKDGDWKIMMHHSSEQPTYQADMGMVGHVF